MKKMILITLLMAGALQANAKGSSGTTGGNPKLAFARPFNEDPLRAQKLQEAVDILRTRVPRSCFTKDYNAAVLTEMETLVNTNKFSYFPETAILGSDRYVGDYSRTSSDKGDGFYIVGAFTRKIKGDTIYFTRNSDQYASDELALTLVQDINDHVLQWNNEDQLNTIGSMVAGAEKCDPATDDTQGATAAFPEKNSNFENLKSKFFAYLETQKKDKLYNWSRIGFDKYTRTELGFTFVPKFYVFYESVTVRTKPFPVLSDQPVLKVAKNAKPLEVIFNPFKAAREITHASISAIIRDVETQTVIAEMTFTPDAGSSTMNVDPLCETRQFDRNDAIRVRRKNTSSDCELIEEKQTGYLKINRTLQSMCDESKNLDLLSTYKTKDDIAKSSFCPAQKDDRFSKKKYESILGKQSPDEFVAELLYINKAHFAERKKLAADSQVPLFRKNIVGGRVTIIPEMMAFVRDDVGDLHSVHVAFSGAFVVNATFRGNRVEDQEDDNDFTYQCFFKGKYAGTCTEYFHGN